MYKLNQVDEILEEIKNYKHNIECLENKIIIIQRDCVHNFVEEYPYVNFGEYSEKCTKCGITRLI